VIAAEMASVLSDSMVLSVQLSMSIGRVAVAGAAMMEVVNRVYLTVRPVKKRIYKLVQFYEEDILGRWGSRGSRRKSVVIVLIKEKPMTVTRLVDRGVSRSM